MYLKRIVLDGFKSFAERTVLQFQPGFTVITGPNGCGKSNVVDAIKWTLGEQSPKSLRGKAMKDVIFGGNEKRPAADYAEVSLVFHLRPGELAVEGNEVTITRRLSRRGDSGYFINRRPARLRDIRDLFLDTGIGATGYYIMEQGRIDAILHASVKDRRALFEEAAGISKFKTQRKETLQKLEKVDINLARLQDILSELEKRLKTVRAQAEKAKKYQDYYDEIQHLKLSRGVAQYEIYAQKLKSLSAEMAKCEESLATLGREARHFEEETAQLRAEREDREERLQECLEELAALREKLSHLQARLEYDQRILRDLEEDVQRSQKERERNRQRILEIQQSLEEVAKRLKEEKQREEQLLAQLEKQQKEQSRLEEEYRQHVQKLEEKKAEIFRLLEEKASLQNLVATFSTRRKALEREKERLDDEAQEAKRREQELLYHCDQKEEELEALREEMELLEGELQFLSAEIERKEKEAEALQSQLRHLQEELVRTESRLEILGELTPREASSLLQLLESSPWGQKLAGLFAEVAHVPAQWAELVERLLGSWLEGLVLSQEDITSLAEWLAQRQEELSDSAHFIPSSPRPSSPTPAPAKAQPLEEIIPAEGHGALWLGEILAQYALVPSLEEAQKVWPQSQRHLVTPEGHILYRHGGVCIAAKEKEKGLLLQLQEQRELQQKQKELSGQIQDLESQWQKLQSQVGEHREHLRESQRELEERRREEVKLQTQWEQLRQKVEEQRHLQESLLEEWESKELQWRELEEKCQRLEEELKEREKALQEGERELERREKELEKLQQSQRGRYEELTALQVDLASVQRQIEGLESMEEQLRRELADRKAYEEDSAEEGQLSQKRRREIEQRLKDTQKELEEGEQQLAALEEEREALEEEVEELTFQLQKLHAQGDASFQKVQKLNEKLNSLRLQKSKVEVRLEDLLEKVREELGVDLLEVRHKVNLEEVDLSQVDSRIQELSQKLRKLGNVNFEALGELEELEERYQSLKAQEEDLLQSKNSLKEVLERLETLSRERFRETFEAIREHFRSLFRKLFGGGTGDLILEAEEDLLEAGIDIVAKPPGKEPRSILLLSGGEKTMTTVALLFALFQYKPSPFCILDEVDAALDENNIRRFLAMLRDFLPTCQFIIVSHSRQTIAAADALYGITMQEAGVSKAVALDLVALEKS